MYTKKIVALTAVSLFFGNWLCATGNVEGVEPLVDPKQPVGKIPAAFNQSAAIAVDGCYDIFATAAFIYWDIQQEGMKIGSTYISTPPSGFTDTLFISDAYKPGFKVGIGGNTCYDNWMVTANYTWLHHHLQKNQGNFPFLSTPFVLSSGSASGAVFTASEHAWHFGIDILDVEMSRPFYQGTRLTINPFFGIRTQWLSQQYKIFGTTSLGTHTSPNWKTSSWGLGPRFGFDMGWLVGGGFRLIGSASGSLIYTHYSPMRYTDPGYAFNISSQNYLRGDVDGKLGFGWGAYLGNNNSSHIDFTATYDFQVFCNQNMITWMMNNMSNVDAAAGDLYLSGLTISGRVDF